MIDKFNSEVEKMIGYYVYRLIDPRTGLTFYVGKGKGNRVFHHIYEAEKFLKESKEDSLSAKIQQIKDIKSDGLEVIHIIHRWGLTEKEAFETEAALIDAYGGLTNLQNGHYSDRGIINAQTLNDVLSLSMYNDEDIEFNYMIIKITEKSLNNRDNNMYETVRKAWKVNPKKAIKYGYVFAVLNGAVKEIYEVSEWRQSEIREGRFEFIGKETDNIEIRNRFCNKLIPEKFRKKGNSNPIHYIDSKKAVKNPVI